MKIATWNVNSVKARLAPLTDWLRAAAPDVVCLQEIKSTDETFPREAFEDLGYNCLIHGQKTYNGVAILSKRPPEDVQRGLPGDDADEQARYIEALIPGDSGMVRVAALYAPNGNPVESEKFPYKLSWMQRLQRHAKALLALEEPLVLAGDYNIIPEEKDCFDPAAWVGDALFRPESRASLYRLRNLGLADAFRARNPAAGQYSFWDYQAGSWQKNNGIRIDFLLLSPQAQDRLSTCEIDKAVRGGDKPSDHVPVWCELMV
ncbi:MAG: exodeoxyribonuclease III [Rhizomicrobium sp.]